MDFGGLVVLGVVWLLFSLLGRKRGESGSRPRTGPQVPQPRPHPSTVRDPSLRDGTQREGSRLEQFLRELERNLEQAAGGQGRRPARLPVPALPDDEDVEERDSLEVPERVVSLETEVNRPQRVEYDQDSGAEELVRRRIAAAEARSGPLRKADHKAFDARIRQEPADHTAVRRYTPAQLRDAIVWREILGPPVSEREP
ncbi:MAG TPA: hypothetical protein VM094_08305 [Gemmatimonadales bacterium]|nr:hypothetical protein [Gemmatimonadales bacterium]